MEIDIHPPFSALPGILLILVVLGETIFHRGKDAFWDRFSFVCLLLCAIVTPFTYYSGYFGAEYASRTFKVAQSAIDTHQSFAQLVFISVYVVLFLRLLHSRATGNPKRVLRGLYWFFLILVVGLCMATAYLGGQLVFQHGAGVSAIP